MVATEKSVDVVNASAIKSPVERQPEICGPSKEFMQAIKDGDLQAARALFDKDPEQAICTGEVVRLAAMSANAELLEWAHSHTTDDCGKVFTHWEVERVCKKPGHLKILEWLFSHPYRFDRPAVIRGAADSGSIETVEWIQQHYPGVYEQSKSIRMDNVACGDNLPTIQWLHDRDFYFSGTATDAAAQNGCLHIVQWLHENRVEGCSTWAMDSAAAFGYLEVLMFPHFNRSEGCTTSAMDLAAENGHLEVVQFLHHHRKEGCTTSAMDCTKSVEILDFLHQHRQEGCTNEIVTHAIAAGGVEILQWVYENKHELIDLDVVQDLATTACQEGVAQWAKLNIRSVLEKDDASCNGIDLGD